MRPHRYRQVAAVGLATLAITIGSVQPAVPAQLPGATTPSGESVVAATTGTINRLTLVTGHRIQVVRTPDGKQAASVEAPNGQRADAFAFTDKTGDLHVVPREALPYVQAGRLDERLFDVTDLIAQGYAKRPDIPLIISYPRAYAATTVAAQAQSLRSAGASGTRALNSADAVALTVPANRASSFWDSVNGDGAKAQAAPALLGGAAKIWLDGQISATLDKSVPLIGAPQAWAAGYDGKGVTVAVLDTGYDASHPDLAGLVTDSQAFGEVGTVADGNGHGSHVASTVAGSGAASQGARKGVAPGAKLMIGKVISDGGTGEESWAIEGMEWAARSGAKVINMSFGGDPSDGSDPMSQAVDSLTAETGALFVVAAGNKGPTGSTVTAPGAATRALTVGNTDKSDQLYFDSSRGPRLGDHSVKPELTGPGTDIVAARAAGTSLGRPVDAYYTALDGTSMASPHVAGAAALLLQQHPDWTPAQLKSALVGATKSLEAGTVFDHGAGRVDVAAAIHADVLTDESTLSFGYRSYPNPDGEKINRTETYRNIGSQPVTLDLTVSTQYTSGGAPASGAATVTPAQLVVPAGGSAQATVTIDPALVDSGADVSGLLVATGNGRTVRTPFSYAEENDYYDLTITATGKDGAPSRGWVEIWGKKMGTYKYGAQIGAGGKTTVRLPNDDYMVIGGVTRYDADGTSVVEEALGGNPQFTMSADATIALDARKAHPLDIQTPRASTPLQLQLGWSRQYADGTAMQGSLSYGGNGVGLPRLSIIPSSTATTGAFEFTVGGRLIAPKTTPGRTPYLYDLALPTSGRLPATGTYRIRDSDLARIDTTFAGVGTLGRTTQDSRLGLTPIGRLQVNSSSDVLVAERTDYVSANGTRWQSWVQLPQAVDDDIATMTDKSRAYPAGATLSTKWWGAPYTAGTDSDTVTDAFRLGDQLNLMIRDYQDGDPFHWGDSFWTEHPQQTVTSRLYRGDELIKEADFGSLVVDDLPADEATYRFVHSISRQGPTWTSSSYSESEWTFSSGREPDAWPPKGIPLLDLNWTIPTDSQNRAKAAAPLAIGLAARHVRDLSGGTLQPAKLWVSYDDGKKWHPVPLDPRPGDRYTAILLHPPKALTTGWVSLRGEIRDSSGAALTQTTLRAYALK